VRRARRPVRPHPSDPTLALVELTQGKWAVIDAADAPAFTGKWRAEIWVNKKHLRFGRFDTIEEAAAVIAAARATFHGEYANEGRPS
jgi:hypothetical protein